MNTTLKVILAGVGGVVIGSAAGYLVANRIIRKQYDILLDEEVDRIKRYYKALQDEGVPVITEAMMDDGYPLPDTTADFTTIQDVKDMVADLGYDGPAPAETPVEEEFTPSTSEVRPERESRAIGVEEEVEIDTMDPVFQEMLEKRSSNEPYVISIDEYMDDRPEYDKVSVTFFEGDDSLVDENSKIIPDLEACLGTDALTKFGLFSKDKDIVYVRNERREVDFEVVRDSRRFLEYIYQEKASKKGHRMHDDE